MDMLIPAGQLVVDILFVRVHNVTYKLEMEKRCYDRSTI